MSSLFEFLFKYRPVLYQEGDFTFLSPWPVVTIGALAVLFAVPAVLTYTRARARSSAADRWVLGALRGAAFVVLFFIVMQPGLRSCPSGISWPSSSTTPAA